MHLGKLGHALFVIVGVAFVSGGCQHVLRSRSEVDKFLRSALGAGEELSREEVARLAPRGIEKIDPAMFSSLRIHDRLYVAPILVDRIHNEYEHWLIIVPGDGCPRVAMRGDDHLNYLSSLVRGSREACLYDLVRLEGFILSGRIPLAPDEKHHIAASTNRLSITCSTTGVVVRAFFVNRYDDPTQWPFEIALCVTETNVVWAGYQSFARYQTY